MRFCCINCFDNIYLKEFIKKNGISGCCSYCNSINTNIISTKEIGEYMRHCLDKAYEDIDEGTGASYDYMYKEYSDYEGKFPHLYSVKRILLDEEHAVNSNVLGTTLLHDIFKDSGLNTGEQKKRKYDIYEDIENPLLVIKNDLYRDESTKIYYSWKMFEHIVKHFNRFFDIGEVNLRKQYLEQLRPFIMEYEKNISANTFFYRARKQEEGLLYLDDIEVYQELSPAPPHAAKTNRMSPAGISYLYLASDRETAYAECRYKNMDVLVAKYVSKEELTIIDFSQQVFLDTKSIFSEEYDHDFRWINDFLHNFVNEITRPVDKSKSDPSYEYVSTQLIAEYIRSLGYDGICFNSSVGTGKSYVFFCGPNTEYGLDDDYIYEDKYSNYPRLKYFTDWFVIEKLEYNYVFEDGFNYNTTKEMLVNNKKTKKDDGTARE